MAAAPGPRAAPGSEARLHCRRPRFSARTSWMSAAILQSSPAELDIADNAIVSARDGSSRIDLRELARIVYFRPDTLPPGIQPELMATRHFVPREYPFAFTNGVQASWLEVDTDTGFV